MKKGGKIVLIVLVVFAMVFALGPKPSMINTDLASDFTFASIDDVEQYLQIKNSSRTDIKPNNESRIVWANGQKEKTGYVLLYLHGFSASGGEGAPTHEAIAKRYGANLYIPRLFGHGVDVPEPMLDFDGGLYLQSAREAYEVAKALGDKVILMGTSTGGTASLVLAAEFPEIEGLVLFAPNIDFADPASELITLPWGLQALRMVEGGNYHSWDIPEAAKPYWYGRYRIEGLVALKLLVETTMTDDTFKKVKQPIYASYYYDNEEKKDNVVSIDAIEHMLANIGTPQDLKRKVPNPEGGAHVLISDIFSGNLDRVQKDAFSFLEEVMHLEPIQ